MHSRRCQRGQSEIDAIHKSRRKKADVPIWNASDLPSLRVIITAYLHDMHFSIHKVYNSGAVRQAFWYPPEYMYTTPTENPITTSANISESRPHHLQASQLTIQLTGPLKRSSFTCPIFQLEVNVKSLHVSSPESSWECHTSEIARRIKSSKRLSHCCVSGSDLGEPH